MLKLHVPDEIQSGTVALSWCVEKELLEKLAQAKIIDPQLVIVIAPKGDAYRSYRETRVVVSLKDLMTFVSFHRSGEHNIFAFVAHSREPKKLRNFVYEREGGDYHSHILDWEGESIRMNVLGEPVCGHTVLTVDVPAECFAKEPPAWEKPWVNWLLPGRAEDQCGYRKRRMFAYTLQVPLAVLIYIIRIIYTAVLLLCTFRGINFRPLFHVLQHNTSDISADLGTPLVMPRTDNVFRQMLFIPLIPIVWVPYFLFSLVVKEWNWVGLYSGLIHISLITLIFFTTVGIIGAYSLIEALPRSWRAWRKEQEHKKEAAQATKLWYTHPREQALLCCTNGPRRQISDLPNSRRTIRLRMLDLKAKVCRPFAR
ncbi:hypothetical protein HYV70_02910 [Candidatus Uhrbacteria bacterium]|nr:hypothetical protein [Candidatus Uhrbacteria bacterium]